MYCLCNVRLKSPNSKYSSQKKMLYSNKKRRHSTSITCQLHSRQRNKHLKLKPVTNNRRSVDLNSTNEATNFLLHSASTMLHSASTYWLLDVRKLNPICMLQYGFRCHPMSICADTSIPPSALYYRKWSKYIPPSA